MRLEKHIHLLLIFACASCSTSELALTPLTSSGQKMGYSSNGKQVAITSQKQRSRVMVLSYSDPFLPDKQIMLGVKVHNRNRSQSMALRKDDIRCFVNGKPVKILTREEKLAHIRKHMKKGSGGKVGKKILAAFAANLANTHTGTTYYSGHVGSHYYSGSATSSYTNFGGAVATNMYLNDQIDAEYAARKSELRILYQHAASSYFIPRSIPPNRVFQFNISPTINKRRSEIILEVNAGGEVHRIKLKLT